MNQLQNWLTSPLTSPAYQARFYTKASRVILLLASIFVYLSNTPFFDAESVSQSTISVSWVIISYCLIIFGLSYIQNFVKKYLYLFVLLLFYLIMFALLQRVYFSKFPATLNFLYTTISLLCCLFFTRKLHLRTFQLFTFGLLLVAILLGVFYEEITPRENAWLIIGRYAVLHAFIYLAIGFRIGRSLKLRKQDKQYKHLFERLNDGIMFVGPLGSIQYVNDQLCEITGYEKHELEAMTLGQLILTVDENEEADEKEKSLILAENLERKIKHKDGWEIWIRFSSSKIKKRSKLLGYVGVCADITQQKEAENQLRRYSEKLSLSNKELEHFSYFASHDLKSPIQAITGFAEFLRKEYTSGKTVSSEARNAINHIMQDSQRMSQLVDALQIYTSSGDEAIQYELVDMNMAVEEASDKLSGFIHANDAHIEYDDLPVIEADHTQIVRLLQNLIENAIIYRKDHSPVIHIKASLNNSSTGYVFSFEDNGVGIDPKDYEKIFVMFQKVNPNQTQGLGIGLAICKKIVENHNGRIWLKSIKGRGTTIYFFLPTQVHV